MSNTKKINKVTTFNAVCLIVFREMLFDRTKELSDADGLNARTAESIGISPEKWMDIKEGREEISLSVLASMGISLKTWSSRIVTIAETSAQMLMRDGWHVSPSGYGNMTGGKGDSTVCQLMTFYTDYRVKRAIQGCAFKPAHRDNAWVSQIPHFFDEVVRKGSI